MFFAQEFPRQPSLVRHREATMNSLKLWRGNLRTKRPGQWAAAWADFHAQNGNQRLEILEDLLILLNPLDLAMKCDENTPDFSSISSDFSDFPQNFPDFPTFSQHRFSPWNLWGFSTSGFHHPGGERPRDPLLAGGRAMDHRPGSWHLGPVLC